MWNVPDLPSVMLKQPLRQIRRLWDRINQVLQLCVCVFFSPCSEMYSAACVSPRSAPSVEQTSTHHSPPVRANSPRERSAGISPLKSEFTIAHCLLAWFILFASFPPSAPSGSSLLSSSHTAKTHTSHLFQDMFKKMSQKCWYISLSFEKYIYFDKIT